MPTDRNTVGRNMLRPTLLRNVGLACSYRLAGALRHVACKLENGQKRAHVVELRRSHC